MANSQASQRARNHTGFRPAACGAAIASLPTVNHVLYWANCRIAKVSAMTPMIGRLSAVAFAGLITLSGAHAVRSEPAAEYYAGNQISLFIGTTAGGGYDLYARTLARHIPRHIPGRPSIIPKNMPGAGGLTLAITSTIAPQAMAASWQPCRTACPSR